MACEFEKFCFLGDGKAATCSGGFCDERVRLERLKKEKCPVMTAKPGYKREICECDLPFWVRALIPIDIPCVKNGNCIIAICLPGIREKVCGDNPKTKLEDLQPRDILHWSSMIKQGVRRFFSPPPTQAPVYNFAAKGLEARP